MRKNPLQCFVVSCWSFCWLREAVGGSEIYAFPEPMTRSAGSFYSGARNPFRIGRDCSSVIKWFYGLEATACDEPGW